MAASLIVNWNAENGTVGQKPPSPLTAVTGPNIPLITSNPVYAGTKAYDVLLDRSQPTILGAQQNPYRTEMRGGVNFEFERLYAIGMAFRRTEWDYDTSAESWPIQVHEAPSDWTNWGKTGCTQSANSTAPLFILNSRGVMSVRNLGNTIFSKNIDVGVWHTLVIMFKLSKSTNGYFRTWYDGVEQPRYPATGTRKTHRADNELAAACTPAGRPTVVFVPPLFATGVYKWDWKIGSTQTSLTTRRRGTLDSIKIAQDTAGTDEAGLYAMVNPAGGGTPDTTAPVISAISETSIGTNNATINFTTDEAATTVINYGVTASYGSTYTDSTLVTTHAAPLSGLTDNTVYNYQIQTADAAGNIRTQANRTFTTTLDVSSVAPVISNVVASPLYNDATVTWDTDEASTSRVLFYWNEGASSFAVYDAANVTSHSITASTSGPLPASTVIDYKVSSVDVDGNQRDFFGNFTTAADPGPAVLEITDVTLSLVSDYIQISWVTNKAATSEVTVDGLTYKVAGLATSHIVKTRKAKLGSGTFSVTSVTEGAAETLSSPDETFTVSATILWDNVI